jgi:hypothetical protein
MREAAITAGLVQSSRAGDNTWRDRLRIITEPEAAAVHCAQLNDLHHLKASQNFMVCDAGGGTVDLAVYKVSFRSFMQSLSQPLIHGRSLARWRISKSRRCVHGLVLIVVVFSLTFDSVSLSR